MCGRYSFGKIDRMDFSRFGIAPIPNLLPRWNISPGTDVLAVRHSSGGRTGPAGSAGQNETALLRWGLIPSWAKDPAVGHKLANARGETAHEKPSFRAAFKARRCLLPADGFFEWQVVAGRRTKQPWRIERADGEILTLGALWEFWRDAAGAKIETCTILTVPANRALRHIHDRLPLVVERHDWARWLSPHTTVDAARGLVFSPPEDALVAWMISDAVNAVSHDGPSIIEPLGGGATVA